MAINLTPPEVTISPVRSLPIVPIRDVVIFPHTEPVLTFGRSKSVGAVNAANQTNKQLVLVTQRDPAIVDPTTEDLFGVGVIIEINKLLTIEGVIHALVKATERVVINSINTDGNHWTATISPLQETDTQGD